MSYKTELQNNNARLQGILNKVNALPDYVEPAPVGGGSMFETSASGRIPVYDIGRATTVLSVVFETSATGAVE